MSQDTKIVVCAQCGKKFQLKADFDAASFQCKGCGATVWVKKKPTEVQSTRKRRAGGGGSRAGGRAGGRARAGAGAGKGRAAAGRRGRARQEEPQEEERPGRARYQRKKDNTPLILGGVAVVALAVVGILVMSNKKDEGTQTANNTGTGMTGTTPAVDPADNTIPANTDANAANATPVSNTPNNAAGAGATPPAKTDPAKAGGEAKPAGGESNPP